MNKTLFSITTCLLGLIMAQQCPAQILHTLGSSKIIIRGDNGNNRVLISKLSSFFFEVELLRGNGVWETKIIFSGRPNLNIECDLGQGSNYFFNTTSLDADIEVAGNGNNTILCGDGDDFYESHGDSRDLVVCGGGEDFIFLGRGKDFGFGGDGDDYIFESDYRALSTIQDPLQRGDGDADQVWGGEGIDRFVSGSEDEIMDLRSEDIVYGR